MKLQLSLIWCEPPLPCRQSASLTKTTEWSFWILPETWKENRQLHCSMPKRLLNANGLAMSTFIVWNLFENQRKIRFQFGGNRDGKMHWPIAFNSEIYRVTRYFVFFIHFYLQLHLSRIKTVRHSIFRTQNTQFRSRIAADVTHSHLLAKPKIER